MPPPLAPTDRDGGHVCQVVAYDRIAEDALRVAEHKAEKRKAKDKTKMLKKQFKEINRMSKEDKDDDDDDLTADWAMFSWAEDAFWDVVVYDDLSIVHWIWRNNHVILVGTHNSESL